MDHGSGRPSLGGRPFLRRGLPLNVAQYRDVGTHQNAPTPTLASTPLGLAAATLIAALHESGPGTLAPVGQRQVPEQSSRRSLLKLGHWPLARRAQASDFTSAFEPIRQRLKLVCLSPERGDSLASSFTGSSLGRRQTASFKGTFAASGGFLPASGWQGDRARSFPHSAWRGASGRRVRSARLRVPRMPRAACL